MLHKTSASAELEDPRAPIACSFDIVTIQEAGKKSLRPIHKALDDTSLVCDEVKAKAGRPMKFYTSMIMPADSFRSLMAS